MHWEQLVSTAQDLENPDFESMDELGKSYPNLSFTVENRVGKFHEIRLFTFQT